VLAYFFAYGLNDCNDKNDLEDFYERPAFNLLEDLLTTQF
jgi:hypothetical protein